MGKPLVLVASPFAAKDDEERELNIAYAQRALLDSINRGEAPFASHLLYPQVLDDEEPMERRLGLTLGWEWLALADHLVVYCDRGISPGMKEDIREAKALRIPVEERYLMFRA